MTGENGSSLPEASGKKPISKVVLFSDLVGALINISKLVLFMTLAIFVAWHWSYFADWATSINHAEIFGVKVDRQEADKHVPAFKSQADGFDQEIYNAAIKEAELLAPAIQDAKIIWVDSHPENNKDERELLQQLGMQVQIVWSTDQLVDFIVSTGSMPDLVISNMMRDGQQNPTPSLKKCPAAYLEFPSKHLSARTGEDIWRFNANSQTTPPAGLAMAEILANKFPDTFGDSQRQRIIFYSASSGGRLFGSCFKLATNRPDLLIHHVIDTLASERWTHLRKFTLANSRISACKNDEEGGCKSSTR